MALFKNKKAIRTGALALALTMTIGAIGTNANGVTAKDKTVFLTPGEFPGKAGKRSSVADQVALDSNKYPLYEDGTLGEYYINKQITDKIHEYIRAMDNSIQIIEHIRKGKSDDLNAAGRKANETVADIYLSIHTNSSNDPNKDGFLCMTPKSGEFKQASDNLAKAYATAMKNNQQIPIVPDRGNGLALQETKIGEINTAVKGMPVTLIEVGYFSSPDDLRTMTNATYVNTIAYTIAQTTVNELQSGKYDKDQKIEIKVVTSKPESKKEIPQAKPEQQTTQEPPTPVEDVEKIEDVKIEEVEVNKTEEITEEETEVTTEEENTEPTKEKSRGLFSIFSKEEEDKEVEETVEIPTDPSNVTVEEAQEILDNAVKELEELN